MVFLGTPRPPVISSGGVISDLPIQLLGHLFLFGVLGLLTSMGTLMVSRSERLVVALIASLVVGSLWASFTEFYQAFVPGRHGSPTDVLLGIAGAACGAVIAWSVQRFILRPKGQTVIRA